MIHLRTIHYKLYINSNKKEKMGNRKKGKNSQHQTDQHVSSFSNCNLVLLLVQEKLNSERELYSTRSIQWHSLSF